MQSSVFGEKAIAKPDALPGRTARRMVSVPVYTALCVFPLAASPLVLPLLTVTDLFRRRGVVLVRCYAILVVFFCAEVVGVAASFWIWLRSAGWRSRPSEDYLRRSWSQLHQTTNST